MQKGRVVSFRSFGFSEFLQKNSFLLIILFFLISGIILGIFNFNANEVLKNFFEQYVTEFISSRTNAAFWKILLTSLLNSLTVLFLIFLLGTSLFGVITVPAAVVLRGFLQGGITAFLYSSHGIKGIAFNAVIYIPSTLIFLIIMLIASRESVKFSLKISSLTLNKTLPQSLANDFKEYSIKFLLFAVGVFASALVDALVSWGFIKNFSF